MSRAQLALNVDDLDAAITFYSKLFNISPAKVKPGYANFAIVEPPLKLVLLENPGKGGTINHLGVEVESSDAVHAEIARLTDEGLFTEEELGTTCCFATQDKVWVTGPAGRKMGDLHRAGRLGHLRRQPWARRRRQCRERRVLCGQRRRRREVPHQCLLLSQ